MMADYEFKNYFGSIYKKDTFGIPMTPSRWVSHNVNYMPITRIKMSCGGGLGGAQWYEYVERIPFDTFMENCDRTIAVKAIDGNDIKNKLINLRFMVSADEFTVATMKLNSQNPNFKKGIYIYRVLLEDGHKIKLEDQFMSTTDMK